MGRRPRRGHWRAGDIAAARRHLDAFRARAERTGRRWALATAARGAGLLATTPDELEAAFTTALGWHDRLDTPFERARTLLLLGDQRRRFDRGDADGPPPVVRPTARYRAATRS